MSNPAPPTKPPGKSSGLILLLGVCVVVLALGYTFNWFEFGKGGVKGHPENVQKSMEATKNWFKDVYAKSKEKFTSAKDKLSATKNADAEKLQKDIDEVHKEISALEAAGKDVDDATKAKLKAVEDRLDKFLKEHETPKAPEKPK
jgi:flagellar motility protein MotE (MotC chaperone)